LSGESLHRRGYRLQHSGAPLKEHLAAALLMQAGWGKQETPAKRLVDPMCGSGTFAIEAAMMAAGVAPGLQRRYFGFNKWLLHQPAVWQTCIERAQQSIKEEIDVLVYASDYDATALDIARANAKRAGVDQFIEFTHQQVSELELPAIEAESLVICNPPWGKRLQAEENLGQLYSDLGVAVQRMVPAKLAIFSANPDLLHRLKLQRISRKPVRNGPLECLFATFVTADMQPVTDVAPVAEVVTDEIALPLRNRLTKNARHLQRWATRNGISCYRVYDADLPEFAFALDRYQSEIAPEIDWYHLQEYQAPATIDASKAEYRIDVAMKVARELFSIPEDRLFCKIRSRQRGSSQYQKQDSKNEFYQVREGAASLLINLSDYLDSGLFLDHRTTRDLVNRQSAGKSLLNLFCYTGTVGVQAGLGGASLVDNVDLSATYLKWARENHLLNGLDDENRYRFLRADIVELLAHPGQYALQQHYDLIFCDPPSFSNSSKMQQSFDVQRDHENLLSQSMKLLAPDGLLLFSTNRRNFKLSDTIREPFDVVDITRSTIAEDFKRNLKIHHCWEIRHRV
jgi:23S rRNA (guanine2445-N2)-methyltransferase / 23S rRNA (guanine2069-N7)-methyltransferase